MVINETFEEASLMLSEHLRKQGKPDHLVWIFQEDITGFRRRLFVHPSPPEVNQELARRLFDLGVKQQRGLKLEVIGFAEHRAYCYVWIPADDAAARQGMTRGLHFTIGVEDFETGRGRALNRVRHPLNFAWQPFYWRFRGESPSVGEVPLRRNLRPRSFTEK